LSNRPFTFTKLSHVEHDTFDALDRNTAVNLQFFLWSKSHPEDMMATNLESRV
jgi:hypothetical protein